MNRRDAIASIGQAIISGMVATSVARAALTDEMTKLLALPLPEFDDPANPSFEVFHRLSQWVVGRESLDHDTSRKLYAIFLKEPWGIKHISTAFIEIRDGLSATGSTGTVPDLLRDDQLGKGETWFVTHLLETWYLGIYYHETGDSRVFYQNALMYQAIAQTHPVPGFSTRDYGFWADPPDNSRSDPK